MRYPVEHKAETHREIVKRAAREFRAHGASGIGIAALMKRLGLTHGGFYRHFPSRDSLLVEAVGQGFCEVAERLKSAARGAPPGEELKEIIRTYLSSYHVQHAGEGCVLAALSADIAHLSRSERRRMEGPMMKYIGEMSAFMPGQTDEERKRETLVLFSSMAGVVATARTIADESARDELLKRAREFFVSAFARPAGELAGSG